MVLNGVAIAYLREAGLYEEELRNLSISEELLHFKQTWRPFLVIKELSLNFADLSKELLNPGLVPLQISSIFFGMTPLFYNRPV